MFKKIRFIFCFLMLSTFCVQNIVAQDTELAKEYYNNGEYEKAITLYEKLVKENEGNNEYFNKLIDCYTSLELYDKAKTTIQKQIKKRPKELTLYASLGYVYEKAGEPKEAENNYQKSIELLTDESYMILSLGNSYRALGKNEYALKVFEKAVSLSKKYKQMYAFQMAEIYLLNNDKPKMIDCYLEYVNSNTVNNINNASYLESVFQRYLAPDDYDILESQLYNRIQENPDNTSFIDLLIWSFIQKKDYKNAFRQTKALDVKLQENGYRVFNLANIAFAEKDYDAAIACYEYLIQKGKTSPFFIDSKRGIMNCRKEKITVGFAYTTDDLKMLESEYEQYIKENDNPIISSDLILDLADLETFFLNNLPKATQLLQQLIETPGLNRITLANAKLKLGDLYLMQGERWESTLLYSQVDKEFKDDTLGHEARFRNARLSYFNADFEWAKSQFGVLKASTSKLISNDAIDLSVFIMDNTGLDTSEAAMTIYAEAELLVFQNKFQDAFEKLDSLIKKFPKHSLEDDVLWLEAQIYIKKKDYLKAATLLEKIITDYKEEIRADNALYTLAGLYANPLQLNDKDKAKSLYEKLFTEFSNSTFAIDARKYFRILRGDKVQ